MSKTITLTDEQYAFLAELAKDDMTADTLVARWVDRLRYLAQLPYQTDEEFEELLYLIPPAPEPSFDSSTPVEGEAHADAR